MGKDAMTAFIGPTAALLFPSNSVSVPQTDTIDTAGTRTDRISSRESVAQSNFSLLIY